MPSLPLSQAIKDSEQAIADLRCKADLLKAVRACTPGALVTDYGTVLVVHCTVDGKRFSNFTLSLAAVPTVTYLHQDTTSLGGFGIETIEDGDLWDRIAGLYRVHARKQRELLGMDPVPA